MKKICFILCMFVFKVAYSQLGVNTSLPLQPLHIDGKKDNPLFEKPNAEQIKNDVVLDDEGKIGVGTINPNFKLDILSDTRGAIRIADGTQGESKVLMSNENGVGTWQSPASIRPTILGEPNTTTKSVASHVLLGASINLTRGKWIINIGQLLRSNTSASTTKNKWVRITLSSSNTSNTKTGFKFISTSIYISGWLSPSIATYGGFSMLTGVIPVEVTADEVTLWTWFAGVDETSESIPADVGNNGENFIFAMPIN
ncbi:hypothetical protein [Myroides odoratimimus]|uniref:hypothetical protein n=1 Tax=Myroides odoratimimus TaxID=76832 RepID=UPI00091F61CC|nr:hypothetical protein [Myroides odoratimimus]SHM43971.1 hypothetical protein SAMN05444275_11370 [Myroides odoratimimus subsp. xuanwuensis]